MKNGDSITTLPTILGGIFLGKFEITMYREDTHYFVVQYVQLRAGLDWVVLFLEKIHTGTHGIQLYTGMMTEVLASRSIG